MNDPVSVNFFSPIYIVPELKVKPSYWERFGVNSAEFIFNSGKNAYGASPKAAQDQSKKRSITRLDTNEQSRLWTLWQAISLIASVILVPIGLFLLKVKYDHHRAVLGIDKKESAQIKEHIVIDISEGSLKNVPLPQELTQELPKGANYALLFTTGTRPDMNEKKCKGITDAKTYNKDLPTIVIIIGLAIEERTPLTGESESFKKAGVYNIQITLDWDYNIINGPHNQAELEKANKIVEDDKLNPKRVSWKNEK